MHFILILSTGSSLIAIVILCLCVTENFGHGEFGPEWDFIPREFGREDRPADVPGNLKLLCLVIE